MRSKLTIAILAGVLVLGTATVLYASSGEGSLSPAKLKDFGWRVMNFVALMIVLIKYLKQPLVNALSARRQGIADQFEGLNERRAEVEKDYQRCEAKLSQIDQEVNRIIENAKAQAETEKARIIEDANRAAEDIKRKAEMSIQFEMSESRQRLQVEIAEEAARMAESLIKQNLQDSDQNRIVEDYLDKVGALQ
jgi:F-type H+-transporting ATPase subunit b